jgi:hypothetical protein
MKTCSTVLFFGEMPYGYDLIRKEEGFELVPASYTASSALPRFSATQRDSNWQIEGEGDTDLKEQIQKLLVHQSRSPLTPLQAAP